METTAARTALDQSALLGDLASGFLSLPSIAEKHELSLEQLLDFLESPPIASLLERLERFARCRARIVASETRARALYTLDQVLQAYEFDERNMLPGRDLASLNARRHLRENARRAATTILRAGAAPTAPGRRTPHDPGRRAPLKPQHSAQKPYLIAHPDASPHDRRTPPALHTAARNAVANPSPHRDLRAPV
jgi:hypothetical protein